MNLILRHAEMADLSTVLKWVPDEKACLMWAGPQVRYPTNMESAWKDMETTEENTFCLVTNKGDVVGLGQGLSRDTNVVHLARIIVDPDKRGRGYGRELCLRLMEVSEKQRPVRRFTLNVYETNKTTISLYRSLGFTEHQQQDFKGVLSMSRPAKNIKSDQLSGAILKSAV